MKPNLLRAILIVIGLAVIAVVLVVEIEMKLSPTRIGITPNQAGRLLLRPTFKSTASLLDVPPSCGCSTFLSEKG